jgi:hypothetical protein
MTEQEARFILQSYRPGGEDQDDPQFSEALREVERNPELARWVAEEQAFDCAVAAQLAALPAPFGLKTRILAQAAPRSGRNPWSLAAILAGVVALLFLAVQVVGLFRPAAPASATASASASAEIPDYVQEMVSFIRLNPPLEMKSHDLGAIKGWLAKAALPTEVPRGLTALEPLGCRLLSFRGHDVALICFQREGDRLAHLFVVNRAAMPKMKPGDKPVFASSGDWMTASWAEGDRVYTIAVQGDRATVRRYLPQA